MHPTSKYIKGIISQTPGYSLEILCQDLKLATEELLTTTELSAALKLSVSTINRYQREGRIIPTFVGGVRRYRRSEINRLINESTASRSQ